MVKGLSVIFGHPPEDETEKRKKMVEKKSTGPVCPACPAHAACLFIGGKFKKWEESSARVIKCDEASVHQRDTFVGLETNNSEFVNPNRQYSSLEGNPKSGCECGVFVSGPSVCIVAFLLNRFWDRGIYTVCTVCTYVYSSSMYST